MTKSEKASGTAQLSELSELSERNVGGKKQASDVTTHKYEGECEGGEGNEDKTRRLFGHNSNTKQCKQQKKKKQQQQQLGQRRLVDNEEAKSRASRACCCKRRGHECYHRR